MTTADGDREPAFDKSHASAELLAALGDLLASVRNVKVRFDTERAEEVRVQRDEVADQLSDYILPRLVQFDAPLLTVVGGSTGAGKSTLTNSIVGDIVTQAGVLRPTTRSPVLVHHPDDAEWFARDRILPDLPRLGDPGVGADHGLRLVATELVPAGLGILDAPDVDSIDQTNRELATQLLAAADLWLFVTSAARYADQVPWEYLRRASERSTSLAVVLDRTAADAIDEVRGHLARMMTARGLSDSPLFTIPESKLNDKGLIPTEHVRPIARWLHDLAGNPRARRMVVGRTLDGAVRHIILSSHDMADALDEQREVSASLVESVGPAYRQATEDVRTRSTDGSLLGGEVQTRWQVVAVTPEFARATDANFEGDRPDVPGVGATFDALTSAIRSLILNTGDVAAEQVGSAWSQLEAGRALLDNDAGADRVSTDVRVKADQAVTQWRQNVVALAAKAIRTSGHEADADLVALCVGVEAVSSADGRARSALDAMLGNYSAQELILAARSDLVERAEKLLALDQARLASLATEPAVIDAEQQALRDAARFAEYARHNDFVNGEIAP